jgi:hypothetical protein
MILNIGDKNTQLLLLSLAGQVPMLCYPHDTHTSLPCHPC